MGRSNLTRLSAVACCACVWLVPSMAWGQATGAIAGLVTDASGSILPGVTVEATNQATAQARTAVTASDGFYTIPLLSPGTYQVKASLSGFRTTIRADIVVTVNGTSRADVQLQVGQIAESVTVVGQAPLVETSNSTLGVVIDRKKVVDLPLNGRNFTQLGTLISRTNRFDPRIELLPGRRHFEGHAHRGEPSAHRHVAEHRPIRCAASRARRGSRPG